MTSWIQNAWLKFSLTSEAGVSADQLPAPPPHVETFSSEEINSEWLPSSSPQRTPRGKRSHVGGMWVQIAYALTDMGFVILNGVFTFLLRFAPQRLTHFSFARSLSSIAREQLPPYGGFLFLYVVLILLFCHSQDLYRTVRTRSAFNEFLAVMKAVTLSTLLLTAFVYLSGVKVVSRQVVLTSCLMNIVTLVAWRYAKRHVVVRRIRQGIGVRNAVIIGAGRIGTALASQFEEQKLLGYRFVGFLDCNHSDDPRVLGKIEDLAVVAQAEFIDDVFITIPSNRELVKRIAVEARRHKLTVKVVPELYDGLGWKVPIHHVGDFPVMDLEWQPLPARGLFVKRLFDLVLALCGAVISAPLLAGVAIWIKLDSKGPLLYRSPRVGKKGRVFTCYKLRTMVANADDLKGPLRHRNQRLGPFFKIDNDPRITRAGEFLRKYSLDELPQLWNVFKGEMSLVGPRPHPLDDYKQYDLDHLRRLQVTPGITGLWQVTARKDPSFERNLALDLHYIENWTLLLDVKILLKTFPEVFHASGT